MLAVQRGLGRARWWVEAAAARAGLGPAPAGAPPDDGPLPPWAAALDLRAAEVDLLLLAAAPALDGALAAACGRARGRPDEPWATLSLGLAALPGLQLSHVLGAAPLRHLGLIELGPGEPMSARLSCPERVWAALVGLRTPAPELAAVAAPPADPEALPAVRRAAAAARAAGVMALVLHGASRPRLAAAAAAVAEAEGAGHLRLRADRLPVDRPEALAALATALRRERALEGGWPVLDLLDAEPRALAAAFTLAQAAPGPWIFLSAAPVAPDELPFAPVEVPPDPLPTRAERWHDALQGLPGLPAAERGALALRLAGSFHLGAGPTRVAVAQAAADPDPAGALWRAAAAHAAPAPGALVQVRRSRAGWAELVVEPKVLTALVDLADTARDRARVLEAWGLAGRSGRGAGITALFSGPSGTGKTLAAEVIANALHLALWRVDLSSVVSKYIGETEKNLGRVFDAADGAGVVLLFDEADALFARRGEVQDAHDRNANLEVGYLLQRMEDFNGLAILTTNMADQLDGAFQRRIRAHVRFAFPDAAQRAALWLRVFPEGVPTDGLDPERLAQLQLSGAGVRAVATRAAFRAARRARQGGAPEAVTMDDLREAAIAELAQQGRPVSERELRGWG